MPLQYIQHIQIVCHIPVHVIGPYVSGQIGRINKKYYSRNIFIPVEYFLVIARYDFQPFEIVRTFRVAGLAYIVV